MAVNYNDKRFTQVESAKQEAIKNANTTYDNMISQTDAKYNELIDASKDYAKTQQELQQENTDFAIEQINQQKEKTEKDYLKEQRGAYTDYQKATNQYGVIAEQQASAGLQNTGYAESSKVSAFNSYQNRYSKARETYNQAILNYDNGIKDAQLKNNAALAEIAFNALKTQLQYSLEGFQYKNNLLQTKLNTQIQLDSEYNTRYQQVLSQINTENALAEQIRQYNESMAYQKQRDAISDARYNASLSSASSGSSSGGSSAKLTGGSSSKSSNTKVSQYAGVGAVLNGGGSNKESVRADAIKTAEKALSQIYNSMYKSSSNMGDKTADSIARKAQKDALSAALKQGIINQSEFLQLAKKYKF